MKLDTFDGKLSQTIALTMKPDWGKTPRQSINSSLSQSGLTLVSRDDLITYGIEFFKPTIIKQTNPLYNSHPLLQPITLLKNTLHTFVSTSEKIPKGEKTGVLLLMNNVHIITYNTSISYLSGLIIIIFSFNKCLKHIQNYRVK